MSSARISRRNIFKDRWAGPWININLFQSVDKLQSINIYLFPCESAFLQYDTQDFRPQWPTRVKESKSKEFLLMIICKIIYKMYHTIINFQIMKLIKIIARQVITKSSTMLYAMLKLTFILKYCWIIIKGTDTLTHPQCLSGFKHIALKLFPSGTQNRSNIHIQGLVKTIPCSTVTNIRVIK